MSVERSVKDVDVDAEENVATATMEISIEELFADGQLRLYEDEAGWSGFVLEGDVFYHVNTRHDEESWLRKIRVGEQAVRDSIKEALSFRRQAHLEGVSARLSTPVSTAARDHPADVENRGSRVAKPVDEL